MHRAGTDGWQGLSRSRQWGRGTLETRVWGGEKSIEEHVKETQHVLRAKEVVPARGLQWGMFVLERREISCKGEEQEAKMFLF